MLQEILVKHIGIFTFFVLTKISWKLIIVTTLQITALNISVADNS